MSNESQHIQDLDELLNDDSANFITEAEDASDAGLEPLIVIDIAEVNEHATDMATQITERLSNYYFDERYIREHPYIPTKIMTEMENIRRLYKMLIVNENAQDALIKAISINAGKGALYLSLTSLQKSILLIQKQLNDLVIGLEQIFAKMQADTESTWTEKEKEAAEDGTLTVRGSREFIRQMNELLKNKKNSTTLKTEDVLLKDKKDNEKKLEDPNLSDCTPIEDIIG